MKICLFLPNWLGDLVMATPALRALRRHFGPSARIVGILRPHLADLLAGVSWLDKQWYYAPRAKQSQWHSWALVQRMRREQFDMAVLFTNSFRTAALAWLGGAEERIGYVRDARGPLLTGKAYPRRNQNRIQAEPMVDYYLRLAEALGAAPESPRLELGHLPEEDQLADRLWQALGLRDDGRVVVFNRSGAFGAAKLWPLEHFSTLAQRIVDQLDHDVLVLCGPGEHAAADELVRRADRPRVKTLPQESLGLTTSKACIRRSRLMVSTDSGPRHLAAALGVPVVTILGPTLPIWIENPTVRGVNVQLDLNCTGCAKPVCPLGHHRCMRELTVDRVYQAVVGLLEERSQRAA